MKLGRGMRGTFNRWVLRGIFARARKAVEAAPADDVPYVCVYIINHLKNWWNSAWAWEATEIVHRRIRPFEIHEVWASEQLPWRHMYPGGFRRHKGGMEDAKKAKLMFLDEIIEDLL